MEARGKEMEAVKKQSRIMSGNGKVIAIVRPMLINVGERRVRGGKCIRIYK